MGKRSRPGKKSFRLKRGRSFIRRKHSGYNRRMTKKGGFAPLDEKECKDLFENKLKGLQVDKKKYSRCKWRLPKQYKEKTGKRHYDWLKRRLSKTFREKEKVRIAKLFPVSKSNTGDSPQKTKEDCKEQLLEYDGDIEDLQHLIKNPSEIPEGTHVNDIHTSLQKVIKEWKRLQMECP